MIKKIILQLCLLFAFSCSAQQVIWEEDFHAGIPLEWNQDDISGGSGEWTYCKNQQNSATANCPKIWNDGQNDQLAFASTSASNGFLVFDSDTYVDPQFPAHDVIITTDPINIAGQTEVWLKLEYQIGVFLTPTNGNALIEIITSQGQKRYSIKSLILGDNPYPEFIRWSRNPEMLFINISDFVDGEESIRIRWRWKGQSEYYWAIDDIELYDENPMPLWLPDNDIDISEFLSFPPAIKTPVSQLDPFGFFGDLINRGHSLKDSVWFKGTISKNGSTLFEDSILVRDLAPNTLRQNILFPHKTEVIQEKGFYDGTYQVINPGDETPGNNRFDFTFEISDSIFAKEDEVNDYARPPNNRWQNGIDHDWAWGNIFYVPNGSKVKAVGMSFSFKPDAQGFNYFAIAGTKIQLKLYEWNDTGGSITGQPDGEIQENERMLIGVGDYIVSGEEIPLQFVYHPFFEDDDLLQLKDSTNYIAMLQFDAQPFASDIKIGAYVGTRYGSTVQRSQIINEPRFHSVLAIISNNTTTFDVLGFGFDISPTVRLHLEEKISPIKFIPEPLNEIELIPNPVVDQFLIRMSKDNDLRPTHIKLYNELGQLVQLENWPRGNNQTAQSSLNKSLAAGFYQLVIESQGRIIARKKLIKY